MTIDNGIRKQACAHHLNQVFVLEILVDRHDVNRLQASGHERVAQPREMVRIAAGTAHPNLASAEVLDRGELGRGGTGDDNLLDVLQPWIDEVDDG